MSLNGLARIDRPLPSSSRYGSWPRRPRWPSPGCVASAGTVGSGCATLKAAGTANAASAESNATLGFAAEQPCQLKPYPQPPELHERNAFELPQAMLFRGDPLAEVHRPWRGHKPMGERPP